MASMTIKSYKNVNVMTNLKKISVKSFTDILLYLSHIASRLPSLPRGLNIISVGNDTVYLQWKKPLSLVDPVKKYIVS